MRISDWSSDVCSSDLKRVVREVSDSIAGQPLALPPAPDDGAGDAPLLVLHASQTGTAEALALRTAAALRAAGRPAEARGLGSLAPDELAGHARVLFVVATYGDGEAPDFARTFARQLREAPPDLDRSEEHTSELQSL